MIKADRYNGQTIALFGLGGSGLASAQALVAGGAHVVAYDDNPASVERAADLGVQTGDLRALDWAKIDGLVLAPGVPLTHPQPHWSVELAHAADVPVIGDIEIFSQQIARVPDARFVAVTGTNGKSTTTALIGHVLKAAGRNAHVGGNIGRAVLTFDDIEPDGIYVVECSSYQIDLAPSLKPDVGILLNLSPDHLDRHGDMKNYAAVKARLVAAAHLAIIGVDDEYCAYIAAELIALEHQLTRISVREDADIGLCKTVIVEDSQNTGVDLSGAGALMGQHNAQNALSAYATCRALGLSAEEIQAGFDSFSGLAHRMERVGRLGEVLFVNDSKATNAEASAPALGSFEQIYWIAGGLPKQGGIEGLRSYFPRIKRAFLIGEAAPAFAASLGDDVPYEISGTLAVAVERAYDVIGTETERGAVVLLSPACASFDQFQNFEIRGDAFRQLVLALPGVETMGAERTW